MTRLWASTNNNSVINFRQGYNPQERGTYQGMCAGLSTLWLLNMLNGVRDMNSKPDDFRAQLVHVKYRWGTGEIEIKLVQSVGLKAVTFLTGKSVSFATEEIASKGGAHLIRNDHHAVASYISGSRYYFYDCESGLYLESNKSDWKNTIAGL